MAADSSKTTKRRLAAVLSADAVGYSRLMSEDEEATIAALGKARDIFRSHIASHDGRVVDTAGDSVLAVFGSVVEALYGLGMALVLIGRAEEGIREVDWAERLSPHDPNLWVFEMVRAWGWISLGDFERAREQAERSVRHPMAGFPAWGTLASALGHLRRIDEARTALAKTRELQPQFSPQFFDRVWPNMETAFFVRYIDGLRLVDPTIADPRLATSRPVSGSITSLPPDRSGG